MVGMLPLLISNVMLHSLCQLLHQFFQLWPGATQLAHRAQQPRLAASSQACVSHATYAKVHDLQAVVLGFRIDILRS